MEFLRNELHTFNLKLKNKTLFAEQIYIILFKFILPYFYMVIRYYSMAIRLNL